jgi:Zn-dependent M28 family amino/carboxypeptidase
MRRFLITFLLASAIALQLPAGYAQRKNTKATKSTISVASVATQRGADVIAAAQLKDYLSFIASDELEGRDTPSRGLDTAAKFLAMNLSRWGFKPAGDDNTFLQRIALRRDRVDADQTRVEFNGRPIRLGEDYIPSSNPGNATGQLIFAGNGWLIKTKNIDAYKDIDAKGKIAMIFGSPNTLPRGLSRADLAGRSGEDFMSATDYAARQGVAGIVYVPDFQFLSNWSRNRQRILERGSTVVEKFQSQAPARIPSITISPELATSLLAGEKQGATTLFEKMYGGGEVPPSFTMNADKKLSLNIVVKNESVGTQNVVGIWEGSDPVLKNEYVALGAHYDHVGIGPQQRNDSIYNGADDDGSGTTALLAMAEALAHASVRPKRSVLFVWHAGEEKGLWGSRYFTEYPTVPLDRIVTQLNIDMIGRSKRAGDTNPRNRDLTGPNDIYVIGSKMMSTELGELSETVNKSFLNLNFDYRYDDPTDPNRFFFRSDHYNYAKKGVPIIFYFDGVHEDYHQPGDSPDKIDYQKMEKVARTIYMTMWEVANKPLRPKVDKQLPTELMSRE